MLRRVCGFTIGLAWMRLSIVSNLRQLLRTLIDEKQPLEMESSAKAYCDDPS